MKYADVKTQVGVKIGLGCSTSTYSIFISGLCGLPAVPFSVNSNGHFVVQFYPRFNFYFPLFYTHYHTLPFTKTKGNKN